MFSLTCEERKVILFVCCLAISGLGLSFLIKNIPAAEKIVYPGQRLAKIDINKVSLGELTALKCISFKLANRIIEHRQQHRDFAALDELKDIKGIGEVRFKKLEQIFFVE